MHVEFLMPFRTITTPVIVLIFMIVVVWTFMYGPSKRRFCVPHRNLFLPSATALKQSWESSGIHGRIAVIFARHLNQQYSMGSFPEVDYLDIAMRQGLVRKAYYIVPDNSWPQVVQENLDRPDLIVPLKTTASGFTLFHIGGRINVMPLSKYIPDDNEPVLAVVDPSGWSPQELLRIGALFNSGLLATDFQTTIGAAQ
jgi:hypothetical protein